MKKSLLFGVVALSTAMTFGQTVKKVLIEEKTGTWCGFCPRGAVAIEAAEGINPNFIAIAIHNGDPMANSAYDTASDALPGFGGYPHAAADRADGADPTAITTMVGARDNLVPAASLWALAEYNSADQKIYITVSATFDSDETGDWRLGAIVVESNITGTTSGYDQHNYYSGGGYGPLNGAGHDWVASPDPIPAAEMEYDHVGRQCGNDAYNGDAGSLPASVTTGNQYYYSYTVDKQAGWDESELQVVAILVEPDGTVNNAHEVPVIAAVKIDENEASYGLNVYPNPATEVANIKVTTAEEANVSVDIYNMMGALVYTNSTQHLAPGKYFYNVDVNAFPAGIYTVKTTVNNIVKTAKLSVN